MFVLLPPSETKAAGGSGDSINFSTLIFPELSAIREELCHRLAHLTTTEAKKALNVSDRQADELVCNTTLLTSKTLPAIARYTGVLYDALEIKTLPAGARKKVATNFGIGSALFGVIGANDYIPQYRLSANSKLPQLGTLSSLWKPSLVPALANYQQQFSGPLIDLRSGGYRQLGTLPGALDVVVMTEKPDGTRNIVSHFNKHYKGLLARSIALSRKKIHDINDLASVANVNLLAGKYQKVEITNDTTLTIVTDNRPVALKVN